MSQCQRQIISVVGDTLCHNVEEKQCLFSESLNVTMSHPIDVNKKKEKNAMATEANVLVYKGLQELKIYSWKNPNCLI